MNNPPESKLARRVRLIKGKRGNRVRKPAVGGHVPIDAASRQAAIEKAKFEWESTADALAALVCLLSGDGKVVRANRVVEDWSLGTVSGVLGVDAHSLFHPGCDDHRCKLAAFLKSSLAQIRRRATRQFELKPVINSRFLQLTIRPMRRQSGYAAARGEPGAVLVATDQSELHRAQDALELLNTNLETRVSERTQALADANRDLRTEILRREQAEVALRASRNELRDLSAQLIGAQEGERKRIAVELHDSVGQSLSAVKYTLERGVTMLRQHRGDPGEVFELAVCRIQETAESIRAIARNLRPRILDELGVASALQWFCRDFAEIYPRIALAVEVVVDDRDVPKRLATVIYRSAQELLNNVAKHAKARNVVVRLLLEERVLTLQVRDNGVGVDAASEESRRHGSGLRNLRERAQMTGGEFSVTKAPRRGTLAQLSWHLADEDRRAS